MRLTHGAGVGEGGVRAHSAVHEAHVPDVAEAEEIRIARRRRGAKRVARVLLFCEAEQQKINPAENLSNTA